MKTRAIVGFSFTTTGVIVIPYLYTISAKGLTTIDAVKFWLLGFAHPGWSQGSVSSWWSFEFKNLLLSLKMLSDIFLSDANYLSSAASEIVFIILKITLTLFIILLLIFLFYRIRFFIKEYQPVLYYLFLWLVIYFIFFSFWDAGNKEHWVGSLIPFTLIIGIIFRYFIQSKFAKAAKIFIIIFIAGIFSFNFFFSIYPQSKLENNVNYFKALFIKEHIPPGSLILLLGYPGKGYNFGKIYIPYFAEREILVIDWETGFQQKQPFFRTEEKIAQRFKQNGQVFILSEALTDNPAMRAFLSSHQISKRQWGDFLAKYKMYPIAELDQDFKIFQLLPP